MLVHRFGPHHNAIQAQEQSNEIALLPGSRGAIGYVLTDGRLSRILRLMWLSLAQPQSVLALKLSDRTGFQERSLRDSNLQKLST